MNELPLLSMNDELEKIALKGLLLDKMLSGKSKKKTEKKKMDLTPLVQDLGAIGGIGAAKALERPVGELAVRRMREELQNVKPGEYEKVLARVKKNNPDVNISMKSMPRSVRKAELGLAGKIKPLLDYSVEMQGGPMYAKSNNTIYMSGMKSPAVLAHEAGHASGGIGKKFLQSGYTKGLGIAGGLTAYLKAYNLLKKGKHTPEERDKRLKKARNYALAGGLLPTAPIMAEEARATAKAFLRTPKGDRKALMRVLGPAYGTYAAKLLPMGIGGGLAVEGYRRYVKRKNRLRRNK